MSKLLSSIKKLTFLGLRDMVQYTNPVLYEWMTEVARKYLGDIADRVMNNWIDKGNKELEHFGILYHDGVYLPKEKNYV